MSTLSPLDRLMPRGYVRQMFCFPSTHADVSHILKTSLAGVVADVPYLLSEIIISDDHRHISLSKPYQSLKDLFSEQDISNAVDYATLKQQHFPPSAFTVPGIIPPDTQPPFPNPAPVFRARLALVNRGFILCVAVHHCTTDITGFGALLKIWASYSRTSASTIGFGPDWLDRKALLEQFHASDQRAPASIPELLHVQENIVKPIGSSFHSPNWTTGIFFFPQKTLQSLKQAINQYIASQDAEGWVSLGDILTVLLWSAILVAESDPNTDIKGTSTIGFPVNFRSRLNPPLSPNYLGSAFVMAVATCLREDLIFAKNASLPSGDMTLDSASISALAKIATTIRTSLHQVDGERVRDVLLYLDAAPDNHPPITLGPPHDGISIVSWADQGAYELDWGSIIGKCDAIRLPKLMNKRYPIVLPRVPATADGDGGLEVIVCFDRPVWERFRQSWPICQFATLRCYS
ncbi:transferase family-domain-containing protein [Hypoxylon trugodes]|uniref:transferase family-domain-containing protein n=1 Tax=Hypoxylon trugodes TaxID=326681 RepID=UPI00219F34AB|nr:transferase family-domain-containing protein [Hypoxylon trugodes]KAI1386733.1 transferase family-domain-containing protein [Hypoxylon trugodes]